MAKYTLTVVDTTGIQSYLFGTNNLRQNAGASYLVDCATRTWVEDVFNVVGIRHNIENMENVEHPFTAQTIEGDGLQAEVLYAGGGNTLILFENEDLAVTIVKELTKKAMLAAPGLQLVVIHHSDFDFETEALGGTNGILQRTMGELARRKQERAANYPTLGLGVTSRCVFTDLPAVAYDRDGNPVSAESWAKERAEFDPGGSQQQTAYGRLTRLIDFGDYKPARDFEHLGASHGEASYMAVVHADGNRMGKRILALSQRYASASDNRCYIKALRGFSLSVGKAAFVALNATVDLLKGQVMEIPETDARGVRRDIMAIKEKVVLGRDTDDRAWILPFRPIVFGGDDTTFVCDGRLGLSLAAYYLRVFTEQLLSDGEAAYCRAGVAIVHTHHPFAQAYALAEALCASARDYIQDSAHIGNGISAIDWHFAVGGAIQDLGDIRQREYTSDAALKRLAGAGGEHGKDMLMRPVRITQPAWDWRSWETFRSLALEFQQGATWRDRRNKVKALRTALRQGPDAVQQFRLLYLDGDPLPEIPELLDMEEQGWQGEECGYYDAVEAADLFIDLENGSETLSGGEAV